MKKIFTLLTAFVMVLGVSHQAEAASISTNWWSNQTSASNVKEANPIFSGPERVRLDNFTDGFIEGTVVLPQVAIWNIDFSVGADESSIRDPNDFVDILIDGSLLDKFFNTPDSAVFDIQHQITGSSFDYRFEFTSSNTTFHLHQIVNAGTASTVPVPATIWLFGSGLIGLFWYKKK